MTTSFKFSQYLPKGAGALFLIQIFSTFSFSVLYSTLVLYMTHELHLSDMTATGIIASFVAFNFALHLFGGYVAGRFMAYRSFFVISMALQFTGCYFLATATTHALYWGLALFLAGSGINVTCINCMVTQLFKPEDSRREGAFLWNYSGMNVGFFAGYTLSGYLQLQEGYRQLFLWSSFTALIAMFLTFFNWQLLRDRDTPVTHLAARQSVYAAMKGIAIVVVLIFALRWLIERAMFSNSLIVAVGIVMAFVIAFFAYKQPTLEARQKILAFLILGFASLIFWVLYQIVPMGLTLFTERNVDRHYLGMLIAPQWAMNINPFIIIFGGPLLAFVFQRLREQGRGLAIPVQFTVGLFLMGVSFVILPVGIYFANSAGLTNFNWIVASYVLQSTGELFISPIGYAMVGLLAPAKLRGVMMGTWLMITGVAATLSSYFSNMALGVTQSKDPLVTNPSFSHTFALLGWAAIIGAVILLLLVPYLKRLTNQKKAMI